MNVGEFLGFFATKEGKFNHSFKGKEIVMASDAEGNSLHDIHEIALDEKGRLVIWPAHDHLEE